jgi:RNA polymerase sigma-70 factor (ECF subfamily)
MADASTTQLQNLIDHLNAGDPLARKELINRSCDRLRRLTGRMLRDFGRVRRWEDTDDVLNNALLRLYKTLDTAAPESVQHFFRLAALQIRRELIELVRHYYGPQGPGANYESHAPRLADNAAGQEMEKGTTTQEPARLTVWNEFHEKVETLPEPERAVFDLLWYQEMTQAEAAKVLNVSEPTVKRRWLAARTRLGQYLKQE